MTWKLDKPIRIGSVICAGISETGTERIGSGLGAHAWKIPRLILWVTATTAVGMDFDGRRYSAEEIDLAYPSAISSLRERLDS